MASRRRFLPAACLAAALALAAATCPVAAHSQSSSPAPPAPQSSTPAVPGLPAPQIISYTSTRSDGVQVPVGGTVYEPTAPWGGSGERPTIIFAPGTRGQGDQCAPSRSGGLLSGGIGNAGGTVNVNYEYPFFQVALAHGMRVVVTDYIGLGTPGHHSYVNHDEEGHALLDAARATVAPGAPVAFAGYSQGGGAAAAAAEQAASYAPELNVKGTYAGGPPADLRSVLAAVDGSAIVAVLGYAINGFGERYPQLRDGILDNFNEHGLDFLRDAAQSCIGDSVAKWGFTRTNWLTKSGESFTDLANRLPEVARVLDEQKLGRRPVSAPIMIANSPTDDIIPYGQARALAGDYCAQGGQVLFDAAPSTAILPGAAVNHAVPMFESIPAGLDYLIGRFNDAPAPSNCAG